MEKQNKNSKGENSQSSLFVGIIGRQVDKFYQRFRNNSIARDPPVAAPPSQVCTNIYSVSRLFFKKQCCGPSLVTIQINRTLGIFFVTLYSYLRLNNCCL